MGPEAAVNAVYYNKIQELPERSGPPSSPTKRAEYAADIDIFRLASELIVDAVIEPDALRAELIARFAACGQADHVHRAAQSGLSGLTRRQRRVPYRCGPAGTTSGPGDAGKQAETEGNGSDCFMSYRLTLLPGDGVGPELTEATLRVLDATGVKIDWDVQIAGEEAVEKFGTPLPDQVLESLRKNRVGPERPRSRRPSDRGFAASTWRCGRNWTCTRRCGRARRTKAYPARLKTWTSSSCEKIPRTCTPASSLTWARRKSSKCGNGRRAAFAKTRPCR